MKSLYDGLENTLYLGVLGLLIILYCLYPSRCPNVPYGSDTLEYSFRYIQQTGITEIFEGGIIQNHLFFRLTLRLWQKITYALFPSGDSLLLLQYLNIFLVFLSGIIFYINLGTFSHFRNSPSLKITFLLFFLTSSGYFFSGSEVDNHIIANLLNLWAIYFLLKFHSAQKFTLLIKTIILFSVATLFHLVSSIYLCLTLSLSIYFLYRQLSFKKKCITSLVILCGTVIFSYPVYSAFLSYLDGFTGVPLHDFKISTNLSEAYGNFKNMILFYNRKAYPLFTFPENSFYLLLLLTVGHHIIISQIKEKLLILFFLLPFAAFFLFFSVYYVGYNPINHYLFLLIPFFYILIILSNTLWEKLSPRLKNVFVAISLLAAVAYSYLNFCTVLYPQSLVTHNIYYDLFATLQQHNYSQAILISEMDYPVQAKLPLQSGYYFKQTILYIPKHLLDTKYSRDKIRSFIKPDTPTCLIISANDQEEFTRHKNTLLSILSQGYSIQPFEYKTISSIAQKPLHFSHCTT